jgi:hypothetical protein
MMKHPKSCQESVANLLFCGYECPRLQNGHRPAHAGLWGRAVGGWAEKAFLCCISANEKAFSSTEGLIAPNHPPRRFHLDA